MRDREVKPDLRALSSEELSSFVAELGLPAFRAKQIFRWLHQKGVRSFDEMTDLSVDLRTTLSEHATIGSLTIDRREVSKDGTRKYALRTSHGDVVEAVYIPESSSEGRNTLCISSQVGCAIDCKFCLTASLGLIRNLSSGEIVEQITRVKEDLGIDAQDSGSRAGEAGPPGDASQSHRVGNIVMMGMGEPLQNYSNVVESLNIMGALESHHISPRRITLSTAGLAPRIPRLGQDTKVNLAVSLNATTDEVRDRIMPINKKYNIASLIEACIAFPLPERRRITFEYVLLAGINDTDDDARRLVKLLEPIRSKVNLIPFNEHPYSPFKRPSNNRIDRFQKIVKEGGLSAFVRTPRGDDISAACGQLGVEVESPKHMLTVLP